MNERIRLLAEQAGIELPNNVVDGVNGPGVVSEKDKLAKFADMIIQECMACSTWVGKVNENVKEPGPIHTAHAINQRIKKHFGVEE